MGGPGSGMRPRSETPPRFEPDSECPELLPTHDSCRIVAAWAVAQVSKGLIPPKAGDTILAGVAKVTASLRADYQERELEELRQLVKAQQAALDEIKRREALGRGASMDTSRPTTGRTRVADAP